MSVSIKVEGLKETKIFLNKKKKRYDSETHNGIKRAGFFVEGEVKESIAGRRAEPRSVDTGRFLQSVKTVFPEKFDAKIQTNVEYAKFLEFGTSRLRPRQHFRNSKERNKKRIRNIIQTQLNTV